jgi:FtsH ternary system domain X5
MSRSYRISVRESVHRVIKAEDRVSTQLEVLEVLPPEQMAGLLADELVRRGFERDGNHLVRRQDGVTVSVDPHSGTVTVVAECAEEAKVEGRKEGRSWDDVGPHAKQVREALRKELQKDLEKQVEDRAGKRQSKVTDQLEGQLSDLRRELDEVVNRVTAEALKRKAAQLGQIKEMTEDPQSGSLTIVVEV